MELSEELKLKAQIELREDDLRKQQALEQFREWISKQGHIKNCRTDSNFLLRFLRVKKYSNANAFRMLETFLVRSQMFPQWFKRVSIFDDDRIRELYDSGYIFPLLERDANGSRVIFVQASKFDTTKFTFADLLKVFNFVIFTLLEEEETQINGIVYVLDQKDISMDYILLFSLIDMKRYLECVQNAIPARQKCGIWTNLPSFATKIAEILKSLVSKKLRQRGHFSNDFRSLELLIDKKILPKEYGGDVSSEKMIEEFRKIAKERLPLLQAIDNIRVDESFMKNYSSASDNEIGSFRKLEID